ncbi:MAG TPA: alpha/beta hydrolase [Thermoanaerobaculia bacterium]|nr:alpha/beta hydrolase [Thermoanaerobaculia bacterium]
MRKGTSARARLTPTMIVAVTSLGALAAAAAVAQEPSETLELSRVACTRPAYLHCPDEGCSGDRVINPGPEVEMDSRRTYFLDAPCDLEPGEEVTFVLSLHGGGSYANWQRHYFPILDFVDEHRLVVATPSSPIQVWTEADDQYLQDVVSSVIERIGAENIDAFWLAGHSQGGLTSRRLVCSEFFEDKVDGFLSLSGGRLGGSPGRADFGFRPTRPTGGGSGGSSGATQRPSFQIVEPTCDFSFIFTTGELEMDEKGIPEGSEWAEKYGCGPKSAPREIVDTEAGYVYDTRRQDPPVPAWGRLPRPGKAVATHYPGCKGDRIVADVVRLDKGHTEGLEPNVTGALVELMTSAPGGKLRGGTD